MNVAWLTALIQLSFFNRLAVLLGSFSFDWNNIVDILIVAAVAYGIIVLLQRTRSMPIVLGAFMIAVVYVLAVAFDFALTRRIFQSFFGIFFIVLVIVFQREIRRFLELIGVWGLRRKIKSPPDPILAATLSSVRYFTEHKIGSLMVFPGREPIERFVDGGIELNGEISGPLLTSIFDDHSPGHDGAVIIEGGKLKKFAVHLPLAENIEAVKNFGTRHRAALGLAEKTDAFCLVTSEEKGTISIAKNGRIFQVKTIDELRVLIKQFFEQFSKKKFVTYRKWFLRNVAYLLISFAVAMGAWIVFNYNNVIVQRNFIASVEFQGISSTVQVKDYDPQEFIVTLSGSNIDFSTFNSQILKISLDLQGMGPGLHKVYLTKDQIKYPANFTLVKIDPAVLQLNIVPK